MLEWIPACEVVVRAKYAGHADSEEHVIQKGTERGHRLGAGQQRRGSQRGGERGRGGGGGKDVAAGPGGEAPPAART